MQMDDSSSSDDDGLPDLMQSDPDELSRIRVVMQQTGKHCCGICLLKKNGPFKMSDGSLAVTD